MSVLADIWSSLTLGMALGVARSDVTWLRPFVTGAAATGLAIGLLTGRLEDAGLSVAALAVLGWDWWNRKGKRVAKAVGAKSLAILAKVVEKARDAGTPVPQGVRA